MSGIQLDPNIILKGQVYQQPDPFDQQNKILNLQNAQLANQRGNALLTAQQAIGRNLQAATNPDGTVNIAKANALNATTPEAAIGVPDAVVSNQNTMQAQQSRSIQAQGHVNQTLTSLAALPDAQMNFQTVRSSLDALRQAGSITPQDEQAALSDFPDNADPATIRQKLIRHTVANLGGPEAISQIYGVPGSVNNGQQQIQGVFAPARLGGGFSGATSVQNQITPEGNANLALAGAQPVTVPQGDGTSKVYSAGSLAAGSPFPASLLRNGGRYPSQPASGTTAPTTAQGPQPIGQTMAPSDQAAAVQQAADSQTMANQLNSAADALPANRATLNEILTNAKQITTGPGTMLKTGIESALNTVLPNSMQIQPENVAKREALNKQAQQLINQQVSALGVGSNDKLAATAAGNIHGDLSNLSIEQIGAIANGNNDALEAKRNAWQAYQKANGSGARFQTFSTQFNKTFDPRVYQMQYMSDQQRRDMLSGMLNRDGTPTPDGKRFAQAVTAAKLSGLVPSGATNGQ